MDTLKRAFRSPSFVVGFAILAVLVLLALLGPFFAQSPYAQDTSIKLMKPCAAHWLGTDEFGRDVLSRLIYGARYSLSAGFVAVSLGLLGGLVLGAVSGYYGGILDRLITTVCDVLLAFPSVLTAMGIVMVMAPGIYTPMIAVSFSSIPIFARLVRAQVLSLKNAAFIDAVRLAGASDARIVLRHLLPNSLGPIVVQATLRIGSSILLASTLSFLGLGAQPPTPEWGAMLSAARSYIWTAPTLAVFPGLAITITVIAVNLLGDALRDLLDPRTRRG